MTTSSKSGRVTEELVKRAAHAFSCARTTYPDGSAETPITDWFKMDAQDAVDFGVLKQPKWDGHSDIRASEQEDYLAAVVTQPMYAALTAALEAEEVFTRAQMLAEVDRRVERALEARMMIEKATER